MKVILKILKGIGIALLTVAAVLLVLTFVTQVENNTKSGRESVSGSASWMKDLPDDELLSEVNIPGTLTAPPGMCRSPSSPSARDRQSMTS